MKSIKHTYYCLALIGALSACGGGGGSNDAAPSAAPVEAPATITKTNAPKVAASAYESTIGAQRMGSSSGLGGGVTGAVVSADSDEVQFDIVAFVGRQVAELSDLQSSILDNTVVGVAIPPDTRSCPFGGTLTLSGEVADRSEISAGDTLVLELDNCDSGADGILNGKITMLFNSITGGPEEDIFGFDTTLTMEDTSLTIAGETSVTNGDMRVVTPDANSASREAELSGNTFATTLGNESTTMTNYQIGASFDAATSTSLTDSRGALVSSEFNGQVTFETTLPFRTLAGDDYPSEGTMLVTGSNDAALRLIVLDAVNVRVEIDVDGDGAFEDSVDTSWAELVQL